MPGRAGRAGKTGQEGREGQEGRAGRAGWAGGEVRRAGCVQEAPSPRRSGGATSKADCQCERQLHAQSLWPKAWSPRELVVRSVAQSVPGREQDNGQEDDRSQGDSQAR